jgi:hypothetical protein
MTGIDESLTKPLTGLFFATSQGASATILPVGLSYLLGFGERVGV